MHAQDIPARIVFYIILGEIIRTSVRKVIEMVPLPSKTPKKSDEYTFEEMLFYLNESDSWSDLYIEGDEEEQQGASDGSTVEISGEQLNLKLGADPHPVSKLFGNTPKRQAMDALSSDIDKKLKSGKHHMFLHPIHSFLPSLFHL